MPPKTTFDRGAAFRPVHAEGRARRPRHPAGRPGQGQLGAMTISREPDSCFAHNRIEAFHDQRTRPQPAPFPRYCDATLAATQFALGGTASAQTKAKLENTKAGAHTSFPALKQIDAGALNVGYVEMGPASGPAVLLLHGWPYDIYSFVDVAPMLASAGYRVIVPYIRGYGTTRFLSADTFRNGQPVRRCARHDRADGRTGNREGDARRLRLGRAHRQHHGRALARSLQGDGFGQRLSDRQPGGRQETAAAKSRTAMVVPVLFRHRARPRRL